MPNEEANLRTLVQETADKLAAIRDDVKVRLHLAELEVKDAWKEAEPHVDRAESELRKVLDVVVPGGAEQVRLELTLGLKQARDRVAKVEPQLTKVGTDLTDAGKAALAKLRDNLKKIEL